MPRYKLRVPQPGDWLYGDADTAVVAETLTEAREHFDDYYGEGEHPYLHSYIGRCRVAYKRDVEAGDCHEDAEPGDTTVDYCTDDGRVLGPGECRAWMPGPPPVSWHMRTLPQGEITADTIPIGTSVHHRRLGSGRTLAPGRPICGWWFIDVEFQRFEGTWRPWKRRTCKVSTISVMPSRDWPRRRFELTVADEVLGEGTEDDLRGLRAARIAEIDAAWKAEQDKEMARVG